MTKILVFTDLHMLPEGHTIIGLDARARLVQGLAHAARVHPDADRVILTGDLTHFGDEASYRRLKQALDGYPIPISMTLGNHDERRMFRSVFPEVAVDENGFVQEVIDFPDIRCLVLDTLIDLPRDHPDHSKGVLCPARIAWLERELLEAGDKPVLIFLHHPPHDTGFKGMDAIKLQNGEALHDLLARFSNVRHIIAGHVHRTISGSHRGIPFSVFKSPLHQQPMPLDISDTSSSVDEPGAYGILVVTPDGLLVHTEDFEVADRAARALDTP